MSSLFFVRHGQASFGKENYDKLSDKGIRQSQILAAYFQRIGIAFDVCYTGTLERQIDTAEYYLKSCENEGTTSPRVTRHEGLNEYDSRHILTTMVPCLVSEGSITGEEVAQIFHNRRSFQRVFEKVMLAWVSGNNKVPGLGKWTDFVSGVYNVVDEIMQLHGRGKRVIIFTSGGPISVVIKRALNLAGNDAMRVAWQIANTSLNRFKCTEKSIMMASFNELAHLEMEGDRELVTYR